MSLLNLYHDKQRFPLPLFSNKKLSGGSLKKPKLEQCYWMLLQGTSPNAAFQSQDFGNTHKALTLFVIW